MNKKFLSAILFGALMVSSTGTFVSCKDYDDDIDRIDNTLNDLKSQIAALQTEVANGDYVTNVTKTADGKGMTFTFSKGKSVTVALDVKDGVDGKPGEPGAPGKNAQQVTISDDGELMIDNVGTGIKAGKAEAGKPSIKIEGGNWWLINEKGEYEDTKIPASGLSAVQNAADKSWTLTLVGADGKQQVVEVPSAATMISEIVVAKNVAVSSTSGATAEVNVTSYTFTKPDKWDGPRVLADNSSVIYAVSGLDIRVNPVGVNVAETPFTLVNTKNSTFPNIKFAATAESGDDALDFNNINGRAANTGNGLWNLGMKSFILSEADAEDFGDAIDDAKNIAYAVTAGTTTRSLYNVAIVEGEAKELNKVKVKEISASEAILATTTPTAVGITVDVNKTYTVNPIESEAFYDMYFTISDLNRDTYGVKWDNAARTFIVTKKPDMVTTDLSFPLTVTTLDNNGVVKVAKYTVNLSSSIAATPDYQPVTYNIPNLYDNDTNNDHFNISLETLKTALGDNYVAWGNNVNLDNTEYYIGEKADGTDKAKLSATTHALGKEIVDGNGTATTDVNAAKNIKVTVNKTTEGNVLKLDKQYYLFVEFYNGESTAKLINSIKVPVTFTAPSVASLFTAKAGYVVDGNINAYFYDTDNKNIELKRYFEAMDAKATLALKTDDALAKVDNTTYHSNTLAALNNGVLTLNNAESQVKAPVDGTTGKELGYGKVLTVIASNDAYKDSYWKYSTDDKKKASFTIKVMSPIAEGTITPATGSSIKVIANSEKGFDITADMISAKDYTGVTTYNIMKDQTPAEGSTDAWSSKQIASVTVAKKGDDSNTYIKSVTMTDYVAASGNIPAKLGTINVKAEPLPNDTPSAIVVTVEDAWGYKTPKDVNVTIATK